MQVQPQVDILIHVHGACSLEQHYFACSGPKVHIIKLWSGILVPYLKNYSSQVWYTCYKFVYFTGETQASHIWNSPEKHRCFSSTFYHPPALFVILLIIFQFWTPGIFQYLAIQEVPGCSVDSSVQHQARPFTKYTSVAKRLVRREIYFACRPIRRGTGFPMGLGCSVNRHGEPASSEAWLHRMLIHLDKAPDNHLRSRDSHAQSKTNTPTLYTGHMSVRKVCVPSDSLVSMFHNSPPEPFFRSLVQSSAPFSV